jgi:hypothetical protein
MLLECACLPSFEPPEPPALSEKSMEDPSLMACRVEPGEIPDGLGNLTLDELAGGRGVGGRLCWMTQRSCCANWPRMLMHPRITTGLLKTNSVAQDLNLLWGPTSSTLPQRRPVWPISQRAMLRPGLAIPGGCGGPGRPPPVTRRLPSTLPAATLAMAVLAVWNRSSPRSRSRWLNT